MHDHKKADCRPLTVEEQERVAAAESAKGALYTRQLASYHAHEHTAERLSENADLLVLVPEAYAMYNYRREILQALWADAAKAQMELNTRSSSSSATAEPSASTGAAKDSVPAVGADPIADLVAELKLNTAIITKDFKIYAAFAHRHWVFEELARRAAADVVAAQGESVSASLLTPSDAETSSATAATSGSSLPTVKVLLGALAKEKETCEQLLRRDERNFHVWNHRRWSLEKLRHAEAIAAGTAGATVSDLMNGAPPYGVLFDKESLAEMAYTSEKIRSNFSNYSAWHQRALTIQRSLLLQLPRDEVSKSATDGTTHIVVNGAAEPPSEEVVCDGLMALLHEDLNFATHAIYCDPNDQAAWFYANFLLGFLSACQVTYPTVFRGAASSTGAVETDAITAAAGPVDIERALITSVLELISEAARLGDAECCLPHYFLLSHLADALRAQKQHQMEQRHIVVAGSSKAVALYVGLAKKWQLVPETANLRTFAEVLHTHLIAADPQRRGLYDDLLSVFSTD